MSVKVKRCSSCGGNPMVCAVHHGKGMNTYWIRCQKCNARTTDHDDYDKAVDEWNRMMS